MSDLKIKDKEIINSRISITFFAFAILSLLSWIYILPFKKHSFVINDYYKYIELFVIIVLFSAVVASILYMYISRRKNIDFSQKTITAKMLVLYSVPAFIASVIIPVSNNRTMAYKYCIIAFLALFLAYATYYWIGKAFSYYTCVCTFYCLVFTFVDYMYSSNVTFSDKISLSYRTFMFIFAVLVIAIVLISMYLSKAVIKVNLSYTLLFSLIALLGIVIRLFVLNYISLIIILIEIVTYFLLIFVTKKKIRLKK